MATRVERPSPNHSSRVEPRNWLGRTVRAMLPEDVEDQKLLLYGLMNLICAIGLILLCAYLEPRMAAFTALQIISLFTPLLSAYIYSAVQIAKL